jgi:hypothetical protein
MTSSIRVLMIYGGQQMTMSILCLLNFVHQWLYSPLLSPGLFFSFVIIFTQTVGLLGRVISLSQGRYLYTQHKHRINAHTDIHTLSGIRTLEPSVRASEDCSCLTSHCPCDRLPLKKALWFMTQRLNTECQIPHRSRSDVHEGRSTVSVEGYVAAVWE